MDNLLSLNDTPDTLFSQPQAQQLISVVKRKKKQNWSHRQLGFVAIEPKKQVVATKLVRRDPIDVDQLVTALLRVLEERDSKRTEKKRAA